MVSFSKSLLIPEIIKAIKELGFDYQTPIQEKIIPHLLSSQSDLIASAQTGTGKTAAFGLPIIQLTNIKNMKVQTLILCPTRELCIQIYEDLIKFSKFINGINILAVYGGSNIEKQIKRLKRGVHIVIGTPGRSKDLLKRKKLNLSNLEKIILDESDEMLTMGFKDDLDFILEASPKDKQILLFSATMPRHILKISEKYMHYPIKISTEQVSKSPNNVNHIYYLVMAKYKYEALKRIADYNPNIYGIVFCRTRRETKDISSRLMVEGYNVDALHGDLSQSQRDEVMVKFRKNQLQLLIATDVAARGLDVNNLTHIINYNIPDDAENYIHRSGRTGRAGKKGTSISIIHSREKNRIKLIENKYKIKFSIEKVPIGEEICKKQLYSLIDRVTNVVVDEEQIEPFFNTIYNKLETLNRDELIKHFISIEFNRFLLYYKNSEDINIVNSSRHSLKYRRNNKIKGNISFKTLYINIGKKRNLNPSRLMGLINETLKSDDTKIGKIDIKDKFSFFGIEEKRVDKLIKGLMNKKFEGMEIIVELVNNKTKDRTADKYKKRRYNSSKSRVKQKKRMKNRTRKNKYT